MWNKNWVEHAGEGANKDWLRKNRVNVLLGRKVGYTGVWDKQYKQKKLTW